MKKITLLCILLCAVTTYAQNDPNIVFPDANFKAALLNHENTFGGTVIDTDGDGEISIEEALAVNELLYLSRSEVTDLTGIEYFSNITRFTCTRTPLTSLDLSQNIKLIEINCSNNELTSVLLPPSPSLLDVRCSGNELTELVTSKSINLTDLSCYNNQLINLDLTENLNLTEVFCYENQLTSLDLTQNTALLDLRCSDNLLTTLDLTKNINLETFICRENIFTGLDLTQNTALLNLQCDNNQLTSLDLTKNINLTKVFFGTNKLTSIDLTQNVNIDELQTQSNGLSGLDLSQNVNLRRLFSDNNGLTSLDLTNNPKLEFLECQENQLTSLDLTQNTLLWWLQAYTNLLETLDVRTCQLIVLDISDNPNITSALLTKQPFSTYNGEQSVEVFFESCPNLEFICIDTEYVELIRNRFTEPDYTTCFVTDNCGLLSVDSQAIGDFKFYPNPSTTQFNISFPEKKNKITVSIIDLLGKTVQKETFRNTNILNVSHQLSAGMYMVRLENVDEASKFNYKLIVE